MSHVDSELLAAIDREIRANIEELGSCFFWWRDDDLIAPTPQFLLLQNVVEDTGIIPLVSIIPALAHPSLSEVVDRSSGVRFCQHGYAHQNHESGKKKSEFGSARRLDVILHDVVAGQEAMRTIAPSQTLPIFVPPWNRASDDLVALLPTLGFTGLSQHDGEPDPMFSAGLTLCNTHIDVMVWETRARVQTIESLIQKVVDQLKRRRFHVVANTPIGILTHHRVMTGSDWTVVRDLFDAIQAYAPSAFQSPDVIFLGGENR